jgi:serine/threonine-protein kinase RsbT
VHCTIVERNGRRGLKLEFVDQGPGIPDIQRALSDGFTSGSGLGLGLGGAKRLCDEFDIRSAPGEGTHVSITKWKPF